MTTHTVDTGGIPESLQRNPDNSVKGGKPAAKLTSTAPVTLVKPDRTAAIKAAADKRAAEKLAKDAQRAADKAAKEAAKAAAKAEKAAAKVEATEGDEPSLPKSIVPASYKAKYAATNDTCGKPLSLALKEATTHASKEQAGRVVLDVEALWAIAKANEIDVAKYVGLNNGQKRMNVYNRLVGRLNNGSDVRIGKQVFRAENHTPTAAPKKTARANKKAAKELGIQASA